MADKRIARVICLWVAFFGGDAPCPKAFIGRNDMSEVSRTHLPFPSGVAATKIKGRTAWGGVTDETADSPSCSSPRNGESGDRANSGEGTASLSQRKGLKRPPGRKPSHHEEPGTRPPVMAPFGSAFGLQPELSRAPPCGFLMPHRRQGNRDSYCTFQTDRSSKAVDHRRKASRWPRRSASPEFRPVCRR